MIFLLTNKRSLAQSANSQQPTANSQQPTANSQQINFNQNNILFSDSVFLLRAVSEFGVFSHFILWLLFFYAYLAVRLRSLTGRQKEILKQVQDDRSHTDYFDKLARYLTDVKYFVRTLHVLTVAQ